MHKALAQELEASILQAGVALERCLGQVPLKPAPLKPALSLKGFFLLIVGDGGLLIHVSMS